MTEILLIYIRNQIIDSKTSIIDKNEHQSEVIRRLKSRFHNNSWQTNGQLFLILSLKPTRLSLNEQENKTPGKRLANRKNHYITT